MPPAAPSAALQLADDYRRRAHDQELIRLHADADAAADAAERMARDAAAAEREMVTVVALCNGRLRLQQLQQLQQLPLSASAAAAAIICNGCPDLQRLPLSLTAALM